MDRRVLIAAALAGLSGLVACGDEIGDACVIDGDCAQSGRICDNTQPGGYCTIRGCDYGTCPEEAVCVRFFPIGNSSIACDQATEDQAGGTNDCFFDEICTLAGYCALRSTELRFCMKACADSGDCRDDYECRTRDLMIAHGGEPVPPPGEPPPASPQGFCAAE